MADSDNRVGNVVLKHWASVESYEPTENGERASFKVEGRGASEEGIAPDFGSSVAQNSGYHVLEPTLPVHANNLIE